MGFIPERMMMTKQMKPGILNEPWTLHALLAPAVLPGGGERARLDEGHALPKP